jgi:lysyl endopeptidase
MISRSQVIFAIWTAGALSLTAIGFFPAGANAQVSSGETPPSFLTLESLPAAPTVTMPPVDNAALTVQAKTDEETAHRGESDIPFQFAYPLEVALRLDNSGLWTQLPDGGRLWRLRISSPSARSLHLVYDRWYLPQHCRLFLYNDDHSIVRGAFTSANNWQDSTNVTAPISGAAVTLEYAVGPAAPSMGELSIREVFHAFRPLPDGKARLDSYGDSGPCNVNVGCPQGSSWMNEKRSVALVITPAGSICSGALLNNTRQDGTPFFLTANHCYSGTLTNWLFRFNFDCTTCPSTQPTTNDWISNATCPAKWENSDFMLLQLSSPPPPTYQVYYAGWNRVDTAPQTGAALHHPRGDITKISVANTPAYSTSFMFQYPDHYWGMDWDAGTVEPGSSGCPAFDQNHRIVGQLTGASIDGCGGDQPNGKFGKLARSWEGGGNAATRLRDYLDPVGTNPAALAGNYVMPTVSGLVIQRGPLSSSDMILRWRPVPGAATYRIYYSASYSIPIGSATLVNTTPDTSSIITNVLSGPESRGYFIVTATDQPPSVSTVPLSATNRELLKATRN